MAYNLFAQQKLTEPVPASDPSKTVEENPSGQGSPTGQNVATAKLQTQPVVQPVQQPQAVTQQPKTIASTEDLAAAMGYTSPEQEEKMRKASLMNRRILAVGDALRHIGNIANTINYAPAQKFNSPVQEEELRYQRGKLLRDKANSTYLTYQMQKAKQDAQQRQWEMQFGYNAAKDARDYELKKGEAEARNNLREAQLNRYQTMMALDEARREGIISDNEYKKRRAELYPEEVRSRIAKNNRTGGGRSGGGGKGNTYWDYDEEGNIHYYPNKTMWEQGVESHSRGQKQQEEFKTIDGYGEQKVTYKKRPTVSKAGENASNANKKKTQPKQSQKKALPGQAPAQPQKPAKKRLPGT